MTAHAIRLRVFLDAGVPNSMGRAFEDAGHEAIYENKVLAPRTPDPAVAATAMINGAILVALDGDMRQIARGHGIGGDRFAALNLIKLSCPEPTAAARVTAAMSLILHEWRVGEGRTPRRLFIEIKREVISTYR